MTILFKPISYHEQFTLTNQLPWQTWFNQSDTMANLLKPISYRDPLDL